MDGFIYHLEMGLRDLTNEIASRRYRHGGYERIIVREKKRRDLAIATIRDRVVHRYVYDQLVEIYDISFDTDVWSCRKSKGLHKSLARTQYLLQKHPHSYVWRADITKFFDHVQHDALLDCLAKKISQDSELYWLCGQIIKSYTVSKQASKQASKQGIPIGNLTSQIFSSIYLNEFDRYIRHTLKPQAYLRYGDDFICIVATRRQARQIRQAAVKFLINVLDLKINAKNDTIVRTSDGLHFLGHCVTSSYIVVDAHTSRSVLQKVGLHNLASYQSLLLARDIKKQLYYKCVDEVDRIIQK